MGWMVDVDVVATESVAIRFIIVQGLLALSLGLSV